MINILELNTKIFRKDKNFNQIIESFVNNNKLFAIIGVGVNLIKNPILKKYKATNFKKEFNKSINTLEFSRILNQEMKKIIIWF